MVTVAQASVSASMLTVVVLTWTYHIKDHSHCLHQQCGSAFVFHHCVHTWVSSCLDPPVYLRCLSILHPNDQFCHMIGIWSPWQGRRALPGAWDFVQYLHMHVGSGVLMFSVAVVVGETEVVISIC